VPTKTIKLSSEDIASVRRVLSHLGDQDDSDSQDPTGKDHLRATARRILELRGCRTEFLNRAMLGEPPYEILLRLYVSEASGDPMTAARLADLAGSPHSSAMRWMDYLVSKDLVTRDRHPNDRRATAISLTPKGTEALEAYLEIIHEAVIWRPVEQERNPAP
jgi:DNA-binding MarR family transcriptional regulator